MGRREAFCVIAFTQVLCPFFLLIQKWKPKALFYDHQKIKEIFSSRFSFFQGWEGRSCHLWHQLGDQCPSKAWRSEPFRSLPHQGSLRRKARDKGRGQRALGACLPVGLAQDNVDSGFQRLPEQFLSRVALCHFQVPFWLQSLWLHHTHQMNQPTQSSSSTSNKPSKRFRLLASLKKNLP